MPSPSPPEHIAILGAGITGLCSAHYLLASPSLPPNSTITLIENSRLGVAPGASSQAAGFLGGGRRGTWVNPLSYSLAEASFALFRELAREFDGERTFGWAECGATGLRVGEGDAERSAYRNLPGGKKAAADGDGEWLNGEREQLESEGTGQVDPGMFCHVIFQHLTKNPAFNILFGEPQALATRSAADHTLTVLPHNAATPTTLRLTKVIVAAGPWSAALCDKLKLPIPPISNLPGHSVILRPALDTVGRTARLPCGAVFAGVNGAEGGVPLPGETAHRLTAQERAEGFTKSPEFFPRTNGVVYLAGENAQPEDSPYGGVHHDNGLPPTADLVKSIIEPALLDRLLVAGVKCSSTLDVERGAVVERQGLCYRPITPDGDPIIDFLAPGVILASGAGPWGITLATGTGKCVAELVLDGEARSADISTLKLSRFPLKSKL